MPQGKNSQRSPEGPFPGMPGMAPVFGNPLMTILTEFNGTLLESFAAAQKDWMDFVHRRIKEDVAASRQLMKCQSLADMHQVYSQYLQEAFQHYQQQSEKAVRRGESMAQQLTETSVSSTKEAARARH